MARSLSSDVDLQIFQVLRPIDVDSFYYIYIYKVSSLEHLGPVILMAM